MRIAVLLIACVLAPQEAQPAPEPPDLIRLVDGKILPGRVKQRLADRTLFLHDGHLRHFLKTQTEWQLPLETYRAYQRALGRAFKTRSADAYVAVGDLGTKAGMRREAENAYARAVQLDPEHAVARAAAGFRRVDGRWITEAADEKRRGRVRFDGKWIPKTELAAARAKRAKADRAAVVWLDWTWSVADDLHPQDQPDLRKTVRRWAKMLWIVGEGNFALRSVKILDRQTKRADMHTPAGTTYGYQIIPGKLWAQVTGGNCMVIPGKCDPYTWLHELGHRLFDTPEEYDTTPGCPCVESTGANGGKWRWCDELTHIDAQREQHLPCWEGYILKAYPKARHPGPGGPQPQVAVTFVDN